MKRNCWCRIIYILILIVLTWGGLHLVRYSQWGEYLKKQVEGYLVDFPIQSKQTDNPADENKEATLDDPDDLDDEDVEDNEDVHPDQKRLMALRMEPRDSVVVLLLKNSLQNRESIIDLVHLLMAAEPAAVGLDIFFEDYESSREFAPIIADLPVQYPNLVLAYSLSNEFIDSVTYPLGISDYEEIPNLGYTNFGLTDKEIRYLEPYHKINGQERPAFWTRLWSISHPDKLEKNKLRSKRRFINFNLKPYDRGPIEIGSLDEMHKPYLGVLPSELVKGKMVIVGWKSEDDQLIVPIHDGEHLMPGIEVNAVALNTIVLNELSNSFLDRYRDVFVTLVILLFSIGFVFLSKTKLFDRLGNVVMFLLGLVLFFTAPLLPMAKDEIWSMFGAVVILLLIAPPINDLIKLRHRDK